MSYKHTFKEILLRFKWKISITLALVIIESTIGIFYPLVIGIAINDLLDKSYQGLYWLTALGVSSLIIGSLRRFYDTRVYANIYLKTVTEMIVSGHQKKQSISAISARSKLMTEFVEFLENSLPDLIESVVAIVGIAIVISTLNLQVFYACVALLILIMIIYTTTGGKNYQLNKAYNDEFEQQVQAISSKNKRKSHQHFNALMRWNIALSDLETVNYFIVWCGVIALFIFTPLTVIAEGVLSYGLVFSILMYVFDYIERLTLMPLHIQQAIRLHEISQRLTK